MNVNAVVKKFGRRIESSQLPRFTWATVNYCHSFGDWKLNIPEVGEMGKVTRVR